MRCTLAPHGIGRWRLLPGMSATPGPVSGAPAQTCGRKKAGRGADCAMLRRHERRCAMSAALVVLPMIWATAQPEEMVERKSVTTSLAFYRKYTEGLLNRYVRMSMEMGRTPSLLGRDMFRARVTN